MKIIKLPNNCEIREYSGGYKEYYQDGKFHRLDGPAVEYVDHSNEFKCWYFYGRLFCERRRFS